MLVGALTGYVDRAYGQAVCTYQGGGTYLCNGSSVDTQSIPLENAIVVTGDAFEVDTTAPGGSGGNAVDMAGFGLGVQGALSFTDIEGASLTAGAGSTALNIVGGGDYYGVPGSITVFSNGTLQGGLLGLYAYNEFGSGAVDITVNGIVTGTDYYSAGLFAKNAFSGSGLAITSGAGSVVSGGEVGILARNYGSGAVTVTVEGDVVGTNEFGIYALNNNGNSTSLTVTTGGDSTVTGGSFGIYAVHHGSEALTIAAEGDVHGGGIGIYAVNRGTDAITIVTDGVVTGGNLGIFAYGRSSDSTDISITSGEVVGLHGGISAIANGTGAVTITATGGVTATSGTSTGISAENTAAATGDLTVVTTAGTTVSGASRGISAFNRGQGALIIEAEGDVEATGANGIGIYARNLADGHGLAITSAGVRGGLTGINARNYGGGALTVVANGHVEGTAASGIVAANLSASSTDINVTTEAVSGEIYGILVFNDGSGALTITAGGQVEGIQGSGISAYNGGSGTDLSVTSAGVSGYFVGIYARNNGSGALTIVANDHVEGMIGTGIYAYSHSAASTGLGITSAGASGGNNGIFALHNGTGDLTIVASGDVVGTGATSNGIYAFNHSAASGGLSITSVGVRGGTTGINARNDGTGALTIIANGEVEGTLGTGIHAYNSSALGTDLSVTSLGVDGGLVGIYARNNGTGTLTIVADGAVEGTLGSGIYAYSHSAASSGLGITSAGVTGGVNGIFARHNGMGELTVTANGDVAGGTTGINARNDGSGALTIVAEGDVVGTDGFGIYALNNGSTGTSLTVTTGANGSVTGGAVGINAVHHGIEALTIVADGDVEGGSTGIYAAHYGTGALSIASNGAVSGANYGIFAYSFSSDSTDLDITSAGVSGGLGAVVAIHRGTGTLTVTAEGDTAGMGNSSLGILASNTAAATGDLVITSASGTAVTGGRRGIGVFNYGSGALIIEADGAVEGFGANSAGIYARNLSANSTGLSVTTGSGADIAGSTAGIDARNDGSGPIEIDIGTASTVTSTGNGFAVDLAGSTSLVTVAGTLIGGGGGGGAIRFDDFENRLQLQTGAVVGGDVLGGADDDTLVLQGSGAGTLDIARIRDFEFGVKEGGGHWTLTGTNNDAMIFMLDAGLLTVGGSMAFTDFIVNDGATLAGGGTVGTTLLADGATLAPGSSIGVLTVEGDLTLSSGSILDIELGSPGTMAAPGGGTSDRIVVSGNLTLAGTLDLSQSGNAGDGMAGLGYYRLITYGGMLTDQGLAIGTVPALADPALYQVQAGAGVVDLFIGAPGDDILQHWQGGDGIWNATQARWLNQGGEIPVTWAGNYAVFRDAGGFTGGTVTLEGTQTFTGLQFVDEGYRIVSANPGIDGALRTDNGGSEIRVLADSAEIAAEITGTGGIVKTEAGTLILSGSNSFQGGTVLSGGVLQVSNEANLGDASGGLTFDGGTLRVTGSAFAGTGRAITWGANGGGFDIADAANDFLLTQDLVGAGDLLKRGDGTLTLLGANAYGNTLVQAGTLVGSVVSLSGDIANAGTVVFDQAGDATFSGDIAGLGGTEGSLVKRGSGILTLAGRSDLGWSIEAGGLVSSAARFGGGVAIAAGTDFTLDDATDAAYGGVISGSGTFAKAGSGTLFLTGDSSGFAGSTQVLGGSLIVGLDGVGALGGSLDLAAGGRIGGSGTIGPVTLADGSTIAPGNSLGTLTVAGDITFTAGSVYEVEVDPAGADSDLIHATGQAFLGGASVVHLGLDGAYRPFSTYTILTADGGIDGRFGVVSSTYLFLDPTLSYDANNVYLELTRNQLSFADTARSRNQRAVAQGAESLGPGHAVYDALAGLQDEGVARGAFDALSGEVHAASRGALLEDSRHLRAAVTGRLRQVTAGGGGPVQLAMAASAAPAATPPAEQGLSVWAQGFGARGRSEGDGNAGSLDRSIRGFLLGADTLLSDDWRVGVAGGFSRSSQDLDARRSRTEADSYHLAAYAGGRLGPVTLRGGAALAWHQIDSTRRVDFPGFSETLEADYSARTAQVFGEVGYPLDLGPVALEPFAGLAYVHQHTEGFRESGGTAALQASSRSESLGYATLGLRGATSFEPAEGTRVTAHAGVGWQRVLGGTAPKARLAFEGGQNFSVRGAPQARNSLALDAGLDVQLGDQVSLGVSYNGQLARRSRDHGARVTLSVRF